MEFKIKPPHKFKLRNIILSLIFILSYSISTYVTLQKPTINIDQSSIDNKIKDFFVSKDKHKSSEDNTENHKDNGVNSNNNNDTYDKNNKNKSDNYALSQDDNNPPDYSKLTIEDYANLCVTKTFGKKNNQDKPYLNTILFSNNHHAIYINLGFYRNRDELDAAALNATVELYKALYTLYPEKFGDTLFGIVIYGTTENSEGKTTDSIEAMFSWYDKKTLTALDINSLTVNNFADTVYRFFNPYKRINFQRD